MTMNTGAPAGASSLPDPTASDPLSSAITAMEASQPKTTSPLAPTKFGKLLKVLEPALEGGTIGAFAGRSHPGGGFGAAQDFYDTKRRHELQLAAFQNTLENSRQLRALEAARTAHEVNQPYFTRGGTTAAQDEEGNDVLLEQNPFTGVREPVPGYRPPAKPDKAPHFQMTDKGLVSIGPDGKASQVTLPETSAAPPQGPPASTGIVQAGGQVSPMFVARKPGSGTVAAKPSSGAPLRAPGFSTPKVAKVANRNGAGAETDTLIDENPNSPTFGQPLKKNVAARAPLPDRAAGNRGKKDSEEAAIEDHVDAVLQQVGNDPDKALAAINADKSVPSQYKARMRNRVREIARPGQKKKLSALDTLNQAPAAAATQDEEEQ